MNFIRPMKFNTQSDYLDMNFIDLQKFMENQATAHNKTSSQQSSLLSTKAIRMKNK